MTDPREPERPDEEPTGEILSVHFGPSANCSSIGSFIDFLFVSSVVGGATIAAVAALLEERRADDRPPATDEEE